MKLTNEPEKIDGLRKMINDGDYFSSEDNHSHIKNEVDYVLSSNEYLKEFIIRLAEKIEWEYMSYPVVINKINKIDNFTLVRYQDGEWSCMLRIEPHYSRKYRNGPRPRLEPLSDELLDILKQKPEYYITVNAGTFDERVGLAWPYLKDLKNLIVGEIFRSVSVTKGLDDFINAIKNRTVILVGPDYLEKLEGFKREHIETPMGGLFEKKVMGTIETNLGVLLEKYKTDNPVVLYSCSFVAKIMCDKFYKKYSNTITQIDMGSTWDPYCDVIGRPYHKKVMKRLKGEE